MWRVTCAAIVACACVVASACGRTKDTAPPVASIAVSLSAPRAESGAPLTVTYTFTMAAGAAPMPADQWVFVHALDDSNELLWTDDHPPSTPTQDWRPGTPVTYTRTMFVPGNTPPGLVRLEAGVFSRSSGSRLPLAGQDRGMRAYDVASVMVARMSASSERNAAIDCSIPSGRCSASIWFVILSRCRSSEEKSGPAGAAGCIGGAIGIAGATAAALGALRGGIGRDAGASSSFWRAAISAIAKSSDAGLSGGEER